MKTTLAGLSAIITLVHAQTPPTPAVGGSGPRPPVVTATALPGPWKAPSGPVTVNGTSYPPPSLTGMGRQLQLNSPTDFCILMPPDPTTQNLVDAEAVAVAYCMNPYNNTRPFPDGFIKTAHFRRTDKYVQISGTYDPAKMNLSPTDCGGEYDNHGPEGVGNPVGAAVDGAHDFMQFMGGCDIPGQAVFCLRACHGPESYEYCKNTFDLLGCLWTMPGDYDKPGFTSCEAAADLPVGVYRAGATVTAYKQDVTAVPAPVAPPPSSNCATTVSPAPMGVNYYWGGGPVATATTSPTTSPNTSKHGAKSTATTQTAVWSILVLLPALIAFLSL